MAVFCVMQCHSVDVNQVPRLFIGGRYVGEEAEIERLHESGKLANLLRDAGALASSDT